MLPRQQRPLEASDTGVLRSIPESLNQRLEMGTEKSSPISLRLSVLDRNIGVSAGTQLEATRTDAQGYFSIEPWLLN